MKKLLQSFLVGIGYDYDDDGLKEYQEDIEKVNQGVTKLTQIALGAATALTGIIVTSTAATDEIGKMAAEVNTSVEDLTAMQFALERSGGSAEGMSNSLRNIARRASEAARGMGEGVEAFGLLGISATNTDGSLKNSAQLVKEVSGALQGVENSRQLELAEKLGLGDSIRLLQQGPAEINKLIVEAKALGVVTAEDAAVAAEFQDGLTDLWMIIKDVSRTISTELAPFLTKLVGTFTDWWKANRAIIQQNIGRFFEMLTRNAHLLKIAMLAIAGIAVLRGLAKVAALVSLLRARILAATIAALILPALLGAAALALVALVEDAYGFLNGKESLLGELIGDFPEHREKLQTIAAIFATIGGTIAKAAEGWKLIISLADKFNKDNLKEVAGNIPGFLGDSFDRAIGGDGTTDGESRIGSFFRSAGSSIKSATIGRINMNILGGGDPQATADATVEKLQGQFEILENTVDQ